MVGTTFGINEIKELLPYRYPSLLLDRVQIESEKRYIGLKCLTFNEIYFQGHFPGHPIFPGVLQVEAMKQVAELAVQKELDPNREMEIYIKYLGPVKFRLPNYPGDRMRIEVDILSINDSGEAEISALTRNNTGVTCQAKMTLSVRPLEIKQEMPEMFTEFDRPENVAMDINKVMEFVPHRYPFLFVDYVLSMENSHVIGVKNTSYNEPFFRSHSPDYAVLPGALHSEIIAQAGAVCILSMPANKNKIPLYMSIKKSEFFHPVRPGDQLICEVDVPEGKSRFGRGEGHIRVGDKIVSKTIMTFAIVDK